MFKIQQCLLVSFLFVFGCSGGVCVVVTTENDAKSPGTSHSWTEFLRKI